MEKIIRRAKERTVATVHDPLLFAVSLLSDAKGFLKAGQTLAAQPTLSLPLYFVLCQAIELILKSYLASFGATETELRKEVGHKLLRAYSRARKKGFSPSDARIPEIIRWMSPFHEDFFFRYRGIGHGRVQLPVPNEFADVVSTLVRQIEPIVRKRFRESRSGKVHQT
jgi:hypothetical protein